MSEEPVSDESLGEQLDDVLESLDRLLASDVIQPKLPLFIAADMLRRSRRQLTLLPYQKKRIAVPNILGRFYIKRKDGIPLLILPDHLDEKIRKILASCKEE